MIALREKVHKTSINVANFFGFFLLHILKGKTNNKEADFIKFRFWLTELKENGATYILHNKKSEDKIPKVYTKASK